MSATTNGKVKGRREKLKGKWIPLYLLTFTFFLLPCRSDAINKNAGSKAGSFLKIATDARGVVLGSVMAALSESSEGLRWNPAALGSAQNKEIAATHIQYYQDVQIENVAGAIPLAEGAVGASVFYLTTNDLDGRDVNGLRTGDFTFYDLVGSIGYGRTMRTHDEGVEVRAGAALKMAQEKIADTSYQNPALDVGLQVSPMEDLRLGATLRNLSSGSADFAKELTLGAGYTIQRQFTGGLALTYAEDAPIRLGVAGEYKFIAEIPAVIRAGYQTRDSLSDSEDADIKALRGAGLAGLKMGAGFEYKPPIFQGLALQLDYAMAPFGALGISHTVTLKAKF